MKSLFFAAAVSAAAIASPSLAATQVLDFSGSICGPAGGIACGNGTEIGANYGDTDQIDVMYRSINIGTGETSELLLRTWQTGFGDLKSVVYGGAGAGYLGEIVLKPKAGYEVSLAGFDFSTYQGRIANLPISIKNVTGDTTIAAVSLPTKSPTHNSLAVNSDYFTDGIVLRWGPNSFDAALDNIAFDVREAPISAAPEPSAWALMLLGFGGLGATLRRRRALAA